MPFFGPSPGGACRFWRPSWWPKNLTVWDSLMELSRDGAGKAVGQPAYIRSNHAAMPANAVQRAGGRRPSPPESQVRLATSVARFLDATPTLGWPSPRACLLANARPVKDRALEVKGKMNKRADHHTARRTAPAPGRHRGGCPAGTVPPGPRLGPVLTTWRYGYTNAKSDRRGESAWICPAACRDCTLPT